LEPFAESEGMFLSSIGRDAASDRCLVRAIQLAQKGHYLSRIPGLWLCRSNLASKDGQTDEAVKLAETAVENQKQLKLSPLDAQSMQLQLARCLTNSNQPQRAVDMTDKLLDYAISVEGENGAHVGACCEVLARAYSKLGEDVSAQLYLHRCVT